MVERNMCNAVMRGIAVPPESNYRACDRLKHRKWNLNCGKKVAVTFE